MAVRIFDWLYARKTLVWYTKPDTVIAASDDLSVKTAADAASLATRDFIDPANKPEIISPAGGAEYYISGVQGSNHEINLQAKTSGEAQRLYWFVNGELFKTALPDEKLVMPMTPGLYQVTCADNFGRNTTVFFSVR